MPKFISETGFRFLWISVIAILLDQWTKLAIVDAMYLGQSTQILPFFNFTYVHNYGAAFSILYDAGGWQRYFLSAVALTVSGVILWWLYNSTKKQVLMCVAFAFILGGAIGNLIDRVLYGYVIDFLDFYVKTYHWPAFNVADSSIFIGAALLIVDMIINKDDAQNEQ
ncbi:MAG: signal peptidase II [Pseudomonadota bacterium]